MAFGGKTVEPRNFVLLDGLRGFGAILVLVGHTMAYWGPFWAPSGAVIVDLFFLLSGFVIAYSYEPKFAQGMGVGEFMVHRIVRLYPLYLLGTLASFAILFGLTIGDADGEGRRAHLAAQLLPGLFVLPAPGTLGGGHPYPLNVPAWTLFFEFLVNLVYVAAFRWLRDTRVLAVIVALCALGLAATVLTLGRIDAGSDSATFWAGFVRAGFSFFGGVLAFRLLRSPRSAKSASSPWAFAFVIALPLVCLIPATGTLRPWVDLSLVIVLSIPLLMLAQAVAPPKPFVNLFVTGGRISYAVYMLQQPFGEVMARWSWQDSRVIDTAPLGGIAVLVAVVGLSWFAEKYYDRPVRRWIVRRLKMRAASRAAARAQTQPSDAPAVPTFAE